MKDDTYYFHQTPEELCKELIKHVPYDENDILFEPFKGEGVSSLVIFMLVRF